MDWEPPVEGWHPQVQTFPATCAVTFLQQCVCFFCFFPKCGKKLSHFPANLSPKNNQKWTPKKRCSRNLWSIFRPFLCETNCVPIFELELSFKIYDQLLKTKTNDCNCKISCDIWFMSPAFLQISTLIHKEETQRSRKSWQHVAYCNFKAPQFCRQLGYNNTSNVFKTWQRVPLFAAYIFTLCCSCWQLLKATTTSKSDDNN